MYASRKKTPRRQPAAVKRSPTASKSGRSGRALVVGNAASARKAILKQYKAAQKSAEKCKHEWKRYCEQDQPGYRRWLAVLLGPLRSEANELQARASDLDSWIHMIHMERMHTRESFHVCYQRVKDMREGKLQDDVDAEFHEERDNSSHGQDYYSREDEEEFTGDFEKDFRRFINQMLGIDDSDEDDFPFGMPAYEQKTAINKACKTKYRELCRRLHPDSDSGEFTEAKRQMLQEAHEAYEDNDASRLDMLLMMLDMENGEFKSGTPLGLIQRMTQHIKDGLRDLRARVRESKHNPDWGFSLMDETALNRYGNKIVGECKADIAYLRKHISQMQQQLDYWSKPPAKKKPRQKAASRRASQTIWLFDDLEF